MDAARAASSNRLAYGQHLRQLAASSTRSLLDAIQVTNPRERAGAPSSPPTTSPPAPAPGARSASAAEATAGDIPQLVSVAPATLSKPSSPTDGGPGISSISSSAATLGRRHLLHRFAGHLPDDAAVPGGPFTEKDMPLSDAVKAALDTELGLDKPLSGPVRELHGWCAAGELGRTLPIPGETRDQPVAAGLVRSS